MALENYTGNISDLVVTNPTPTDPKSQGDDHLRGIKFTLKQTFPNFDGPTTQLPGQITPDTVTLGDNSPASGNHFWDGSVANQLVLKRGTPDEPGAELLKFLNGVASFPNQGQALTVPGYVKLPGGLIIQWGMQTDASGNSGVTFPIPFPTATLGVQVTGRFGSLLPSDAMITTSSNNVSTSGCQISGRYFTAADGVLPLGWPMDWIAIGY